MAETAEIDARIAAAEGRIHELVSEMQTAYQAIVTETFAWAEDRYEKRVTQAITKENPNHAKEIGKDGLAKLRSDLNAQKSALAETVASAFESVTWPHRSDNPLDGPTDPWGGNNEWRVHTREVGDPLKQALVGVYKTVAELLKTYGFRESNPVHWSHWATELQYTDGLVAAAKAYGELNTELIRCRYERNQAARERAEVEAAELWNEQS